MIKLTIFNSQFDNKTDKCISLANFDQFEKMLYGLAKKSRKGKKDAELISPAVYEAGTTRANKNVTAWAGWCAVDVDDIEIDGALNDYVDSRASGWRYVCYSTASSRLDKPKFRLVFELDRHVAVDEIKHFWFALQSHLDDAGDKQCKDLSRMYYIPATYDDAHNFIFSGGNVPLCVSDLLAKYPYVEKKHSKSFIDRLPPELATQVVEYRKSKLQNSTVRWNNYNDCPFVNQNLIKEYKSIAHIDNSGRYAMIYRIMVSIASSAIKQEYPITVNEIVTLIKQLDMDTSNRYSNRPLDVEADRALEFAFRSV